MGRERRTYRANKNLRKKKMYTKQPIKAEWYKNG